MITIKKEQDYQDSVSKNKYFFELSKIDKTKIDRKELDIIESNFYFKDSSGKKKQGVNGFMEWCLNNGSDIENEMLTFLKLYKKYKKIRNNNLFDVSQKIKNFFTEKSCIDKLFYYEFYSVKDYIFPKIGQQLLYAKQNQDRELALKISDKIKTTLIELIEKEKIDSVVFIPPTTIREFQFMIILEKKLKLNLPKIKLKKIILDDSVPQKDLKNFEDRVKNAEKTFLVEDNIQFKKTLVIDDAVGSGATMNQIACKLKKNKNSKEVIGFSIVGNLNNFKLIWFDS